MTDSGIRASDAERDAVAERLRVAYAEGRLTADEFGDRLDRVLGARSRGELAVFTADLPLPPARPRAPAVPAVRTGSGAHPAAPGSAGEAPLRQQWAGWAGVNAMCLAAWVVTCVASGSLLFFWPIFVLAPWGIGMAGRTTAARRDERPELPH